MVARARGIDSSAVATQLEAGDRQAFTSMLARYIGCQPTETAVRAFAAKYPDRYAQMLTMMDRLAFGSSQDRTPQGLTIYQQVIHLSDAELMSRLVDLEEKLRSIPGIEVSRTQSQPEIVDVTPRQISDCSNET